MALGAIVVVVTVVAVEAIKLCLIRRRRIHDQGRMYVSGRWDRASLGVCISAIFRRKIARKSEIGE